LRRLPVYSVSTSQYLIGSAAGLISATAIGMLWGLFPLRGFLFEVGLSLAAGYALGELVNLSVNRKRGRGLQIIAAAGFLTAFLISRIAPSLATLAQAGMADLGNLELIVRLSFDILTRTITNPLALIIMVVGVLVTASRLR
jgi:hypothetical protein